MPPDRRHGPDHLISPECSLRDFCYRVSPWPLTEITSAASAEIAFQRTAHRRRTGSATLRSGTRLRRYCDDLQQLLGILLNGHVPDGARPEFLDDLRPLMVAVLRQVEFNGNVEEVFRNEAQIARRPVRPEGVQRGQ